MARRLAEDADAVRLPDRIVDRQKKDRHCYRCQLYRAIGEPMLRRCWVYAGEFGMSFECYPDCPRDQGRSTRRRR